MILEGSGVMNLNPSNNLLHQQPAWTDSYPMCNGKGALRGSCPMGIFALLSLGFVYNLMYEKYSRRCEEPWEWRKRFMLEPSLGPWVLHTEAHLTYFIVSS